MQAPALSEPATVCRRLIHSSSKLHTLLWAPVLPSANLKLLPQAGQLGFQLVYRVAGQRSHALLKLLAAVLAHGLRTKVPAAGVGGRQCGWHVMRGSTAYSAGLQLPTCATAFSQQQQQTSLCLPIPLCPSSAHLSTSTTMSSGCTPRSSHIAWMPSTPITSSSVSVSRYRWNSREIASLRGGQRQKPAVGGCR